MKWRCPQCGKPHERNDPPCDNCGHHKLEEAVVPTASADDDYEQFAWACTECGRIHQRNSPPCKRCGNPHFEKESMAFDDTDVGGVPSYRELIGRFEAAAIVAVVALVVVLGLGLFGVIQVPGIPPVGTPSVSDVPGDNETYGTVSLADVETNVTAGIDEQRTSPLEPDDGLDSVATYVTRRTVKNEYTDADRPVSERDIQRFETDCSGTPGVLTRTLSDVDGNATAATLAASLQFQIEDDDVVGPTDSRIDRVGVEAHVGPDGSLFVTVAFC